MYAKTHSPQFAILPSLNKRSKSAHNRCYVNSSIVKMRLDFPRLPRRGCRGEIQSLALAALACHRALAPCEAATIRCVSPGNTHIAREQLHHIFPFHFCVVLGRPDLELDERDEVTLCERREGDESKNQALDTSWLSAARAVQSPNQRSVESRTVASMHACYAPCMRRAVVFMTIVIALAMKCGGTVNPTECESSVGPFTSPLDVPFDVNFGTAITTWTCEPASFPPVCSTGWTQLDIVFTPGATGCPSNWIPGTGGDGITQSDVSLLWLGVQIPTGGSFVGTYTATSGLWDNGFELGYLGPFIVSAVLVKGTDVENGTFPAIGAGGTITISKSIPGQDIAGTFDANFADGTHLSGAFDVPFCTSSCFAK